uniref:Gem-associated protein 7 n=1 Tax=Setaria digitata TaxID=48799 RepID=A0A915PI31_9BILA
MIPAIVKEESEVGESILCGDTTEQKQRAELRERFLRLMSFLGGKQIELDMHERTHVTGKFAAVKADQTHYIVDALITPIGVIDHAILRMNDTVVISTDDISDLPDFKFSV